MTETIASIDGAAARAEAFGRLRRDGYCVMRGRPRRGTAEAFLLEVARDLGELYVPPDCDPAAPLIRTAPQRARRAAPFDRREAIGWHGDFSTHGDRPELSLSYVTRPDPRGGDFGAWRLASVARVVDVLRASETGLAALSFLSTTPLPFSYADGEDPRSFLVFESRPEGNLGLRFYLPSLERGCVATYGEVPKEVASALAAVERAADEVAEVVPTHEGSLLITNNWFALHDRMPQTISRTRPNREALLCFVARQTAR